MTFDGQNDGQLTFTYIETNLFSSCFHKEVRVIVANDGSNWVFDQDPQKVKRFLSFLILERRLVSQLTI